LDAQVEAVKRERDTLLREAKRFEIRGWEVALVPFGAPRPAGAWLLSTERFPPADPKHGPPLEVLLAPRTWLAKLCARLA
jgi:hypothetical protein